LSYFKQSWNAPKNICVKLFNINFNENSFGRSHVFTRNDKETEMAKLVAAFLELFFTKALKGE
jgi:hypothetical protein